MKTEISVVIITHNESANIGRCLLSLKWVSEIVLVDAFSTDDTIDIDASFPNTKILRHEWLGFVESKNIALQHTNLDFYSSFWGKHSRVTKKRMQFG